MTHFPKEAAVSYPEPRYTGEGGEVSATYRANDHQPEVTYPDGAARGHFLATGALTRGMFGLFRWELGPGPSGPGPHFQRTFSESFYVLTGSIRIYDGRSWIDARPGDFLHVPEGGIHAFRNESGAPASLLIHFASGAPREAYFAATAEFARSGRLSDEEMEAFYLHHDNVWLDA